MLSVAFTFPAGRYHATPWGKHVNEGDIEWPPSPWRIVRALIAVWHRKVAPQERDPQLLAQLLGKLASEAPAYCVPEAVHAHTRHYMPGKSDKKALIFDAFARLSADEQLVATWANVRLSDEEAALLDLLLNRLGFLGRAESWADAQRLREWKGEHNCIPQHVDIDERTDKGEQVSMLVPMRSDDYADFASVQREGIAKRTDLKPSDRKTIYLTLPDSWLDALSCDTADLRAAGWTAPPACQVIRYVRATGLLGPMGRPSRKSSTSSAVTTFRFAVYGKPLPLLKDAVKIGELLRAATMSCAKAAFGEDAVPSAISGHGLADTNRHSHAFWLPEDSDGDGHIDHVLIHVPAKVAGRERAAIGGLRRLWNRDGEEWQLVFEGAGAAEDFATQRRKIGSQLCAAGTVFQSVTPYLMPWHQKKRFGIDAQIRRECSARGLADPISIEVLPHLRIAGKIRRPIDFHRFRSKRGMVQPDTHGAFLRVVFPSAVQGPLALGYGCHFGLGLFAPQKKDTP